MKTNIKALLNTIPKEAIEVIAKHMGIPVDSNSIATHLSAQPPDKLQFELGKIVTIQTMIQHCQSQTITGDRTKVNHI